MPNQPFPHSDPDVVTRFQEVLARAAAMAALAPASAALWPRFAGYYQGLARLPRKAWRYTSHLSSLLCFYSYPLAGNC